MAGAQWDFQGTSGGCDDGKFVSNSTTAEATTEIKLSSVNTAGSDSSYIRSVAVGNLMRFTNMEGQTLTFLITSMGPVDGDEDCSEVGLAIASGTGAWGGRYVIDVLPGTGA